MAADVAKLLERAKRYLEKNKVEDAIEAYLEVLEAAPGHLEGLQALGDLYARREKPERAAVYYGLLFDRLSDPREESKAAVIYSRFLKGAAQPPERAARYALLLQKQAKMEEAVENYSAAADQFLARGSEDAALACWERIAELEPDNAARHEALGRLGEKLGKTAVAARGYLRAGQLVFAGGELNAALNFFERAWKLTPGERGVGLLYGQARLRQGNAAEAVRLLEPFAASEKDTAFLDTYGQALMRAGELDRARQVLEQLYQTKSDRYDALFELADLYCKAKRDADALGMIAFLKQRMFVAHREGEFAAAVDRLAESNPTSVPLTEFWGALYNELNREAKYFDVLARLFDLYLDSGNLRGACETLEKLVDIDPYDFRVQQRIERLQGRVEPDYLQTLTGRLSKAASQGSETQPPERTLREEGSPPSDEPSPHRTLDDLIVQAEIFLQYSLQGKAVERLQHIAEQFPGEEEHNERLRTLYEQADWWPAGSKRKPDAAHAAAPAARSGAYSADTLRDLSKISEINHLLYRQPSPRAVLSAAVNEVGSHLHATRCLAVVGAPGQPPQMAAEFCAPGVEASGSGQIIQLLSQIERAAPDSLGGLPLDAAAGPVLREMGLETALGVQLVDKETQAAAAMLVAGFATPHRWKQNETYFLQAVGDQMLLSASHLRLRTLVRNLAVADERTGLLGRSSYQDCLLGETQRAKVQSTPLALAILQVDSGAELLQVHGEALLDRHMEQVARAIQPHVRQNDLSVKYTAWALAFILPDTTLAGAKSQAEKLRHAAAGVPPPWNGGALRVSAAVAEAITRPDYENEDIVTDLMNRAEAGLDETRKRGDALVSLENPWS